MPQRDLAELRDGWSAPYREITCTQTDTPSHPYLEEEPKRSLRCLAHSAVARKAVLFRARVVNDRGISLNSLHPLVGVNSGGQFSKNRDSDCCAAKTRCECERFQKIYERVSLRLGDVSVEGLQAGKKRMPPYPNQNDLVHVTILCEAAAVSP